MIHIYASCGVWELVVVSGWSFNIDKKKNGSLLALELKFSLEELQKNVREDFGLEETDADLGLSYLSTGSIGLYFEIGRSVLNRLLSIKSNGPGRSVHAPCFFFA